MAAGAVVWAGMPWLHTSPMPDFCTQCMHRSVYKITEMGMGARACPKRMPGGHRRCGPSAWGPWRRRGWGPFPSSGLAGGGGFCVFLFACRFAGAGEVHKTIPAMNLRNVLLPLAAVGLPGFGFAAYGWA